MGDAGSNFLGFLLGALTVVGNVHRDDPADVFAVQRAGAAPGDGGAALRHDLGRSLIRLREGRSPFEGDRRHFSHRLVARGLTPPQAVWTIDLVTLAGGLGRLLLHRLDGAGACVVWRRPCCLLGVVAILELSANRSEQGQWPDAARNLGRL